MTHAQQFERVEDGLLVRAPAKVNLSLLVAGKRPDGFHELETIMAKVDWYDEILLQPGHKDGIELICTGPHWAPEGPENLVVRAADKIFRLCGRSHRLRVTLTKNIPAGSGLGSASSDAAATLMGLEKYLDLALPPATLMEAAAELGSDVAFFLNGPLAFCTGRGEQIRKLSGDFSFVALLILPDISVSTKEVYANYTHDPAGYEDLHNHITDHIAKNRIDLAAKMCANMLERSCFQRFEELGELKKAIASCGAGSVCLSGSGSVLFCIVDTRDVKTLRRLRDRIACETGCKSVVVRNNCW